MRNYGAGRSILVDKHRRVIAGNKTLKGAQAAGITKIKYVKTTGDTLVVVQRQDLDLAKDAKAKELAVIDNRASEVGLEWSVPVLQALAGSDVDLKKAGFTAAELASLFGTEETHEDGVPEMDLRPFEHHDYLVVVFTNSQDWAQACELLAIKREAASVGTARKIGLGRVIKADRLLAIVQAAKAGKAAPREKRS